MSLSLKINTIDRSSWIDWKSLTKSEGLTKEPDTLSFSVRKTPTKTIPSLGDTIELYEGSTKIFKGTITERNESILGGLLFGYSFTCKDPSYQLDKMLVIKSYQNMAAGDIVKSIIDTFTTGFTYTNVSSGSATIATIRFNYEQPSQCIQKIADMIGWDWYVDYNNDIHFFDGTTTTAPFGIDDSSGNLEWRTLSFDSNILELKNSIIVRGGQYAQTLNDTTAVDKYIADGTQRVFTNIYQYANITIKKNSTVLNVGIDNIDDPATKDVLYNYTEKAFKFRDDNKPSNGDTVKIYGDAQIPLIVKVKDNVSVLAYGEFQHIEIDKTISSINEAKLVAKALLAQWTQGSWQGSFKTTRTGLITGMQILINSPKYGINQSFKINRITGKAIGNDRMEYTVNFLASGDTNFTDIMIGLLGQDTQNIVVSDNEVLERLEDFTESMTLSDSLSVVNITSGPYKWGSDPNPLVWSFGCGAKSMKKEIQNIGIQGMITVRRYKAGTVDKARAILAKHGKFATEKIAGLLAENFLGIGARNSNLIVSNSNHGRNIIAQQLGGITTYALPITYAEMGTGSAAPTNADTALTTAVARQSADAVTIANNVVDIQFFFSDGVLPNNTYNEFGTFCGGSGTLGSGQLFNHALFSPSYVKTSGEDTTIDVEFTIN